MTERPAERTATRTGSHAGRGDDTTARSPLADRIQAKLANAADEHRANARRRLEASRPQVVVPAQGAAPGPAPADPGRPVVGDEDRVPALDRVRTGHVVSVFMIWSVLGAAGVWDSINQTVQNILGGDGAGDFDVQNYVGVSRVMGFTMLVAVIDVVLITAIATLGAFLYNMAAALLGGIEVTLTEDR